MVNNRIIALLFRVAALAVSVSGLILGSGFATGPAYFLFYTTQSNMLYTAVNTYLVIRTAASLAQGKIRGSASYCPRLQIAAAITVGFTFIIFWGIIAPFSSQNGIYIDMFMYGNLAVHCFAPLLAAADCLLFVGSGHMRRRDILFTCIIPTVYVAETVLLELSKFVYYSVDGVDHFSPYPFMDFYTNKLFCCISLPAIALCFAAAATSVYFIDRRIAAKENAKKASNNLVTNKTQG